jgi:hypothetical protein
MRPDPPQCARIARNEVGWRRRGHRERNRAAVEHDDDSRHAWPEVRRLLDAEQRHVDEPQHLRRLESIGRAAVEQTRYAPTAPVPPNLYMQRHN